MIRLGLLGRKLFSILGRCWPARLRPGLPGERTLKVSFFLLGVVWFSVLFSLPPAAAAPEDPAIRVKRPRPSTASSSVYSDPQVQGILRQAMPQLGNAPSGLSEHLAPGLFGHGEHGDEPSTPETGDNPTPTPPPEAPQASPAHPTAEDEATTHHGDDCGCDDPDPGPSPSQKPEPAVVFADPREHPQPFEVTRQTHEFGSFLKAPILNSAHEVLIHDYLTHLTQKYEDLADSEIIRWKLISPNPNNNVIDGAAGVVEWRYHAQGEGTADFKAKYTLQVKVFDKHHRSGKVVFSRKETTKLCFLQAACKAALRDLGVWEIRMYRGGEQVKMVAVDVELPQTAEDDELEDGLTRRWDERFIPLHDGGAFVNDDYLHYQRSYTPSAPDHHGRQKMNIEWSFRGPNGQNRTSLGSALTLRKDYSFDGSTATTVDKIYDKFYPRGHTYQVTTSTQRAETLLMAGGPGLSRYGTWRILEKVDGHRRPARSVPVRSIISQLLLPAGTGYADHGNQSYQIQVATFPEDWNPGDISWQLRLYNHATGTKLADYQGVFLESPGEQLRTTVQAWDGRDDETGERLPPGTVVSPLLGVFLMPPGNPQIQQLRSSAAFSEGQRAFAVTAQSTPLESFFLAGNLGASIDIDDDLYIYINDDPTPVWSDTDGGSSFVIPQFQAHKGDRLRMVAVDAQGICRHISGPIILHHPASGHRQVLRSRTLDDFCRDWPENTVFLDITYTIVIPTPGVPPTVIQPATTGVLPADCFPQLTDPEDRAIFNRNTAGQFLPGPECRPRPIGGGQYLTTGITALDVSTANDLTSRGSDRPPYPFNEMEFCSPVRVRVNNASGTYSHRFVDLSIPTRGLPLVMGRCYNSEKEVAAPNFGWTWDFQESLVVIPGGRQAILKGANDSECVFTLRDGEYRSDLPHQTEKLRQLDDRHFEVTFKNKTRHIFEVPEFLEEIPEEAAYRAVLKQKIDRNDNALTYLWDRDGQRLKKIQGPVAAQYLKLHWSKGDSQPRLERVEDHTGREVCYSYTKTHHVQSIDGPDWLLTKIVQPGKTTYEHTYHPILGDRHYRLLDTRLNGVLQERIGGCDDQPGQLDQVAHIRSTLSYERTRDENNGPFRTFLTVSGKDGISRTTQSVLDEFGRVFIQIDPASNFRTIFYNARHDIISVHDPAGNPTEMAYNDRRDLISIQDALGHETRMEYSDDLLRKVTNAKAEETTFEYDSRSNLTKVTDNLTHSSLATYDQFGLVRSVRNNSGATWTMDYDSLGFVKTTTVPATSDGQPATSWRYTVDSLGRTRKKQDALGRAWTFRFDERSRLVEASVPEVSARYRQEAQCRRSIFNVFDRDDRLVSSTALDGRQTRYEYCDCHQLKAVHLPGYPRPVKFDYNSMSELLKLTNTAGKETSYEVDELGRTTFVTYPNGDTEAFSFDSRSNLTEWNRGGQVITYGYDELSRLKTLDSGDTGDHLTWDFDELSRVTVMHDSSGSDTTYTYTGNGLMESIFRGDGRGLVYSYDVNDRLRQVQDHEGATTEYHFNERNEVTRVDHDDRSVAYSYDLVGRLTGTLLPNGIQCQRAFDERNRLIFLNYKKGGAPLLTYKYGHNQLGQRIVEDKLSAEQCKLTRYEYNPRRELIKSLRQSGRRCTVTSYGYDLNHNRIKQNQTTYENNGADQLLSFGGPSGGGSLSYNAQGQAQQVQDLSLAYNQSQQIKRATGPELDAHYFYDGSGRRVAKEINGTRSDFLLIGHTVLKSYADGALKAQYLLGLGREGIKVDGQWNYYLSDGLGSTAALVDEAGSVVAAWDYSDYGETSQIAGESSVYNPFLYTGQEWDAELGMYNLRARHYAPQLGRFLARDPIGYGGGSNLYSYCNGDPINYADPSGLKLELIGQKGGQLFAALPGGVPVQIAAWHAQLYYDEVIGLTHVKYQIRSTVPTTAWMDIKVFLTVKTTETGGSIEDEREVANTHKLVGPQDTDVRLPDGKKRLSVIHTASKPIFSGVVEFLFLVEATPRGAYSPTTSFMGNPAQGGFPLVKRINRVCEPGTDPNNPPVEM